MTMGVTPTDPPGVLQVTVLFAGQNIDRSPFGVNVAMALGDAGKVTARGPGLEPLGNVANKPTYFDIYTAGGLGGHHAPGGEVSPPRGPGVAWPWWAAWRPRPWEVLVALGAGSRGGHVLVAWAGGTEPVYVSWGGPVAVRQSFHGGVAMAWLGGTEPVSFSWDGHRVAWWH